MDFLTSWTFIIILVVVLLGLIGVMMYLRNKKED